MADFRKYDGTKKILVTGAAGFIGFHLSKRILDEGGEVIGFDNLNDYYEVSLKESRLEILNKYEKFTFIKGNLADRDGPSQGMSYTRIPSRTS